MHNNMEVEKKFSYCGDYQILQTLGSGFHAKVKLATKAGAKVAIKIFKNEHETAKNIQALANEINILKKLNHPNLINLIEFNEQLPYRKRNGKTEKRVCIILELAESGELFEYIAHSGRFLPEISRFYFKQLLNAMNYMAQQNICHRDLKLENILLDINYNLKVADFGFAKVMEQAKTKTTLGTPGYMAPEISSKQPYNGTKVDIFSAGVILFIMFAGSPPFQSAIQSDPYFRLFLTNRQEQFWATHAKFKGRADFFPPEFKDLLNGMLAPNPENRFTLEQCLQHPWVNGPTATHEQVQAEFKNRHNLVKQGIEAEKQRAQQQKQAQAQAAGAHKPIGKFKDGEIEIDSPYLEIEQQYNLKFNNRELKQGFANGRINEIISFQNPKTVFCELLKGTEQFQGKVQNIHETKYKINFDIVESDEVVLQILVELQQLDEDSLQVHIVKVNGDSIKYHEVCEKIRNLVQNIKE